MRSQCVSSQNFEKVVGPHYMVATFPCYLTFFLFNAGLWNTAPAVLLSVWMNFESQVKNSTLIFQFTLAILCLGVSESKFDSIKLFSALTLNLLTTTIVATPSNASKWQIGFNSVFKGLNDKIIFRLINVFKVTNDSICKLM